MWNLAERRREKAALAKLKAMKGTTWVCGTCEQTHSGMMDIAKAAPDVWRGEEIYEPNSALRLDGDFLSEDFCVIDGENFIVRGVLKLPVKGLDKAFGFGVWSTLSRENFETYVDQFDEGWNENDSQWFSWFCSDLSYFGKTFSEKAWLRPQPNRQRPHIFLSDPDHALSLAQKTGITASEMLKIYEFYGQHTPAL